MSVQDARTVQTNHDETVPGRRRFWLGFIVGFALLALGSCATVGLAMGLGSLTLEELRGVDVGWTPPAAPPTPSIAEASDVNEGISGRFQAGQTVTNVTGSKVNVRRTPGHLGKDAGDVVAQLDPGGVVVIVGESAAADNLKWWRVSYRGFDGWVAEATSSGVQILGE
jgi:hypothetical protein